MTHEGPGSCRGLFYIVKEIGDIVTAEQIRQLADSWKEYNEATLKIKRLMNGTANIMGDYSEIMVAELYQAEKLTASTACADLRCSDGTLIQVKSRQVKRTNTTTQLGIIRHWEFQLLVVVLFYEDGSLFKVLEMKSEDAHRFAKSNSYQRGDVITTTKDFLESRLAKDKTADMRRLLNAQQ